MNLQIEQRERERVVILDLKGWLVLGEEDLSLLQRLLFLLDSRHRQVILNIKEVSTIDESGLDTVVFCAARFHEIRRVVTNLGVFDFETPDHSMRLRSVHPGVSVEEIVKATGFALTLPARAEETRAPTDEELRLIRELLDPRGEAGKELAR